MKIEMNFSPTREHHKYGAKKFEDTRKAPADDVLSLNSWSEKLNLSTSTTSSSSDSSLRQGMVLSQGENHGKEKAIRTEKHAYSHERPVLHSVRSYNATKDEDHGDLPGVGARASLTLTDFEYDSISTISHPDYSFLTNLDRDYVDSSNKGSYHVNCMTDNQNSSTTNPSGQNIHKIQDNKPISGKKDHHEHGKGRSAHPRLLQSKHHEPQEDKVRMKLKLNNSNQPEKKSETNQQDIQSNLRPRFFDYTKSQTKKHSVYDSDAEPFSSLPTILSESQSEMSYVDLASRGSTRIERAAVQGKAASMDRLHSSQPMLSMVAKKPTKLSNDLESNKRNFLEHKLEPDNLKMKVKAAWNNFKYGFNPSFNSNMKRDSPLYLLGKCYHRRKGDSTSKDVPASQPVSKDPSAKSDPSSEDEFFKDFFSRIWLTYRINFYPIPGTTLNTDCGWGCMLRSGQMLIAQCLVTHYLSRDWRLHNSQTETEKTFYREIIRWFSEPLDAPSDKNPFCLHQLANFGRIHNKDPGQWYGPSSVAYIFRDAFTQAYKSVPILSQLCVYVAQDCTVYIEDVLRQCTAKNRSESVASSYESPLEAASSTTQASDVWLRSVIILIPMRLGGEVINEIYAPCIKGLLSYTNCMGIIGGKPKHSLYFLGYQDDNLLYLDPHRCQDAIDTSKPNFKIESYHCSTPRKMPISKMDPSCTVGFYIHNAHDFYKFVHEIKEFTSPAKQRGIYPLFTFAEGSHRDSSNHSYTGAEKGRVRVTHYHLDENGQRQRTFSRDSEEFVML